VSHYKPYPAYKDSGVEWLERVPEHWQVAPLKRDLSFLTSGSRGWAEHYSEIGALFLRIGNLRRESLELDLSDIQFVEVPAGAEGERTKVLAGDVLFSITAYLGSVAVVPEGFDAAYVSQHVALARIAGNFLSPNWVGYVALSWVGKTYLESQGYGGTKIQLSLDDIANMVMTVPSSKEQETAVHYLDRETARIDALIEKKTRFIELLREKRQALITHAVTKGLDPNVKMKDSGVEWLGEVPEHWRVMAIKHIVATPITDGPHETPEFLDEGVPFVSAEAVSSGRVDFAKIRGFISRNDHERYSQKYCPKRGDIFMIKSGATTGVTAIVETDDEFNIWSPLAVIRCGESADPYFVLNFMRSRSFQEAVALSWSYGTQQNIGMGVIGNLAVTVPPLDEQKRIALSVHAQCVRLDDLIDKTERSIELLKERRSALITAAVTGQIDLREAV
jgi:type I restriction enzyme S subunit